MSNDVTKANVTSHCIIEIEKCTPEDRFAVARALLALYSPVPQALFGGELVDAEPLGYIPGGGLRGRRVRP